MKVSTEERIAKCEAMCESMKAELEETLRSAYAAACEAQEEELAADLARKIRTRMLEASDNRAAFDRLLPDAPSGSTFSSWLSWLRSLAQVKTNAWGVYRQSLRDLTEQPGFPFNIEWPEAPEE